MSDQASTATTRRNFISTGAVAAVAPFFIQTSSKGADKLPVTGSGEHQYEVIHDWGLATLPSNIKMGNTHSIIEDSQGHIYVHHTVHKDSQSSDAVLVYDEKGKFIRSWGPMFRGGAHGMHLS